MSEFCVIYNKGKHDSIEERGSRVKCEQYVKVCQPAFDKELRIVPLSEARTIITTEVEGGVVEAYEIVSEA
jgi:hypothetical protein